MFAPGTPLGKYILGRKLGQGGFGSVFAAYDESLEREVALKILNAEHKASDDVMRRFLQEARVAARIGHPGIVTVFECAQVSGTGTSADGIAYIAMELLDGESLMHRLHRSGRMPTTTAMEITRQIASALQTAHEHGIVHRDLKPDNIFIVRDPAVLHGERVKVLDFGIAKLHHFAPSDVQTQTSEVFGTPRYMSPEQCRSSTQIDARSDIYTLGCIFFELLTGRPPFIGQTGELFAQHLMVEAPSVLSFVRDTPYHIADLVARMLAKDVAARPQTMADVQRELEASGAVAPGVPATLPPGVSGAMPADPDTTLKAAAGVSMSIAHPGKPPRLVYAAAAGLAIAVALGLVLWLRSSSSDEPAARVAALEVHKPNVTPVDRAAQHPPEPAETKPAETAPAAAEAKPAEAPAEITAEPRSRRKARKGDDKKAEAKKLDDGKRDGKQIVNPFDATAPAAGSVQLRSSPACEILVDGRAIAKSTPQTLQLPAGKHRITLVHDELDIKDSFTVEVRAGAVEKVNRDLHDKIKAKKRNATINPFGGS